MSTDTQTCTSCHTEKPLSEFHRRGDHYQKSCKTCRCLKTQERYNTSGRERITSPLPTNKENIQPLSDVIENLEVKLRKIAKSFSTFPMEADDIYSAIVEDILTKAKPSDTTAGILRRARWTAHVYINANRVYDYSVHSVSDESHIFSDYDNPESILVEQEVSSELQQIINQLPEHYRTVISMLSVGMTQREIAKQLHISNAAVNQRVGHIRKDLTSLGLSFA